jgi:hypothetical protein
MTQTRKNMHYLLEHEVERIRLVPHLLLRERILEDVGKLVLFGLDVLLRLEFFDV